MKAVVLHPARQVIAGVAASVLLLASMTAEPSAADAPAGVEVAAGDLYITSLRDGGNAEIYRLELDGSNPRRLTHDSAIDRDPSISPLGNRLAFESNRDGNFEIFTMNIDGSGLTQVTFTSGSVSNLQAAWSPDETQLAFSSNRDGNYELYLIDAPSPEAPSVNGEAPATRLTNDPGQDTGPVFRPDAQDLDDIFWTALRDGNFDIYSIPSEPGGAQTRRTFDPGVDFGPSFPGDGLSSNKMLFNTNRWGDYEGASYDLTAPPATADQDVINVTNRPGFDDSELTRWGDYFWEGDSGGSNFQIFTLSASGAGPTRITTGSQRNGDPTVGLRPPRCGDFEDNDRDGLIDGADTGCADGRDNSEGGFRIIPVGFDAFRFVSPNVLRGSVHASRPICFDIAIEIQRRRNAAENWRMYRTILLDEDGDFSFRRSEGIPGGFSYRALFPRSEDFAPDGTFIVCQKAASSAISIR